MFCRDAAPPPGNNEGMPTKKLTPLQSTVLKWVADRCPTDPEVPNTYKTSARTLANRDLVKIKGSGKTWNAKITERGKRVLAGKEPLKRAKHTSPFFVPQMPTAAEKELVARAKELVEGLVASERKWVV